jgi:hypothetical protein
MNLNEFKQALTGLDSLQFLKPDGTPVPIHIHVTEIGKLEKHFMDCGGKERKELAINVQLWEGADYWHRFLPSKLLNILNAAEQKLSLPNATVQVEFNENETIGIYGVKFKNGAFQLIKKPTKCLALETCCVPIAVAVKQAIVGGQCSPNSGCCN